MSLSVDVLRQGTPMASLAIRRLSSLPSENPTYAYQILFPHDDTVHGTVDHAGPEDLFLLASVLSDYATRNPDAPATPAPTHPLPR